MGIACAALAGLRREAPGTSAIGWERGERESVIASLDALIRDATFYRGQVLLAHKEDGAWGTARDRDFTDWRSRTTGTGRGAAAGELGLAQGLEEMPDVAGAVEDGRITLEHAKTLTRLREHASKEVKDALDGELGTELLDLAATLPAPELGKQARARAAAIDAAAAQADFEAVRQRRSLTSRRYAGGRKGEYFLDDVGGTIVDTAVDAIVGKPAADDTRTREQRRADALVTMASRVLQVGSDLNGAQIRPHLSLLVTEDTWTATTRHRADLDGAMTPAPRPGQPGHSFYRAGGDGTGVPGDGEGSGDGGDGGGGGGGGASADDAADARRAGGGCEGASTTRGAETGPGGTDGSGGSADEDGAGRLGPLGPLPVLPDVEPATLEDGSIVPLTELQRLACDCEMTRIVLDADSRILDVGQTQRHYTRELRRAVTARDRHCQWPSCTLRASWCEVHHITWWSNNGPTSTENGLTLCSYHHHRVHADHIRITTLTAGHAFHNRHGTPIGTTTYPKRTRRTPGARRNEPDGLTPPGPGTTGTTVPVPTQPGSPGTGAPRTEGTTLPTIAGTALPTLDATAPPELEATAPTTVEGTTLPAITGTAPTTVEGTTLPTIAGTAPPTLDATAPPEVEGTAPTTLEATRAPTVDGTATPPTTQGTGPPTLVETASTGTTGPPAPTLEGTAPPTTVTAQGMPAPVSAVTTGRRVLDDGPIQFDVGDPPF